MKERDPRPNPDPAAGRPPDLPGGPAKILVVDDNEDILNVIRRILASQPYQILTAQNGKQALATAEKELPDVILLDVMLPEMDGLTVCRQLKSDPATQGTMILLVTGRGSIEHRAEGLDAGADDYIPKPFHMTELLARVRSALRIKRLTDELRERNRQLVDSQRDRLRAEKMATIGLLATGLAHEFNNIMSGISGYAQLAQRNPKFRDQLVEVALVQSERALELTKSLSTFYRPSAENRPISLARVVENALCLVQKELEERHIEVTRRLPQGSQILGSSGQLQEVVLNLVLNAIHAVGSGGHLEISIEEGEGKVKLTVRDDGCGIPQENLDRIFDPFFTTKGALGGGNTGGSGLGLSVSYNIVRAHGGNISVKSAPGKGATFTVTLPVCPPLAGAPQAVAPQAVAPLAVAPLAVAPLAGSRPPDALPAAPGQRLAATAGLAGLKGATAPPEAVEPQWGAVLVADGEESVRGMITQYLQAKEVVGASDWSEAVGLARKRQFQFAILDADLPGSPGPRLALEELRRINPSIRVILTSRRYPDGPLLQAVEQALGHLLKPYTMENLAGMMSRQPVAAS